MDPVEAAMDRADARLERIIRETAAHFGTMEPAIVAVAHHVMLNVDGEAEHMGSLVECDCLEPAGA